MDREMGNETEFETRNWREMGNKMEFESRNGKQDKTRNIIFFTKNKKNWEKQEK